MKTRIAALGACCGMALALSACSADAQCSGIAQLDQTDQGAATAAAVDAGTAEEQALAFAQCMRDNGVDFADPTVDADGNPSFEDAFAQGQGGGFDPGDDSFRTALDECGDLMEGLAFGPGGGGDFDQEALEEALFTYTQCLRDEGLDVGDITLDSMMGGPGGAGGEAPTAPEDGAQPTIEPGAGGEAPPEGVQGPGGDPSDRFADQLGQDADDPAWIAANETCQPLLEEAMTSTGMGGGR